MDALFAVLTVLGIIVAIILVVGAILYGIVWVLVLRAATRGKKAVEHRLDRIGRLQGRFT